MHPAFSVIFLTTLLGVGQGLFLALFTAQSYAAVNLINIENGDDFFAKGSVIAFLFLAVGLFSSFFHLGHPERAWRAAAMWRTSWLSREVIVLPVMMGILIVYGALHAFGWDPNVLGTEQVKQGQLSLFVGILGTVVAFALYLCTAMIYASLKFLQEWYSPLTVINYILFGGASGFALASAYAMYSNQSETLVTLYATWAIIMTMIAFVTRTASLIRNARLKHKSSIQTAIGVRHSKVEQKSQGFMGGSFNTREFFHGKGPGVLRWVKWVFLVLVFPVPVVLLAVGMNNLSSELLMAAFVVQYLGLLAERWFFFAQANHPQNLYYQTV